MPLLLIDLDDTLIDRRAGFRNWAHDFCARRGIDVGAVPWLEEIDAFGYTPREEFLARIRDRFSLTETLAELLADYDEEYPTYALPPGDRALELMRKLRAKGWRIGVVTNGRNLQSRKLDAAGLTGLVDTCCVSGVEGVRKPDPRIFELAAERCGEPLAGGWMAGDNPQADIGGADALGLGTIWFRHGRDWDEPSFAPTLQVDTLEEALGHLNELP